ncbi:unnamed protein product [Linum trigynum]|uniref:Uncharacterized protein n=1 Tax=Linum trigynum TaxID=586398 RepID=A0AAV2EAF2_9ROSI
MYLVFSVQFLSSSTLCQCSFQVSFLPRYPSQISVDPQCIIPPSSHDASLFEWVVVVSLGAVVASQLVESVEFVSFPRPSVEAWSALH